jgi:hypothetical protein
MDALGVLAFVVFILCVIAIASGVTWLVVRYSPAKRPGESAR